MDRGFFEGADGSKPRGWGATNVEPGATKVAFVRQLPTQATEQDLERLGEVFGRVVDAMRVEGKSMGFIEFETADICAAAIDHYQHNPATLYGQTIDIKPSTRDKVTKPLQPSGSVLLVTVMPSARVAHLPSLDALPDTLNTHFSSVTPGAVLRIVCFEKAGQVQGLVEFKGIPEAETAYQRLMGYPLPSGHSVKVQKAVAPAPLKIDQQNTHSRDFTAMPRRDLDSMAPPVPAYQAEQMDGYVVLVSQIPINQHVTPDTIYNLFATCGDVMRVKILFAKRDSALVQYRDAMQARVARHNMNGVPLFGSKLVVAASRQKEINTPQPGSAPDVMELTKDYSDSPLHRFRVPNSKNFRHIAAPHSVLHISNIPEGMTDDQIQNLLSQHGPVTYQPFNTDKKMGLATMASVDAAVAALVTLHGTTPLGSTTRLSITFSDQKPHSAVGGPMSKYPRYS